MAGELLSGFWMHAPTGKIAYKRVPEGVEVEHPARVIAVRKESAFTPLSTVSSVRDGLYPARSGESEVRLEHPRYA